MASGSRCQIVGGSLRYNPLVCELSRQALPCRCRADGRASTRWRPGLEGGRGAVRCAPRATSSSLHLQVVGRGAWPPLCVGRVCDVFVSGIAGLAERDAMPWPARGWVCVSISCSGVHKSLDMATCMLRPVFVGGCCQESRGRMCVRSQTAPRHTRSQSSKGVAGCDWATCDRTSSSRGS